MLKTKIRAISRYAAASAILVSLALLVNSILDTTASGTSENGALVEKIIAHRDFFDRIDGYGEELLCDVNDALGENRLGILLMDSSGMLKSLVFDRDTLSKIHEDTDVPSRKLRASLARNSIPLSDARFIAGNVAEPTTEKEKSPRRRTARRETSRREVMPQSLPDGFSPDPAGARKRPDMEAALNHLRKDVENNPKVSAMTSEEILERFRKEIQESNKTKSGD